ncbi:MAG: hypothetical protein ACYC77_09145 [Coriobacteriia bacterium]
MSDIATQAIEAILGILAGEGYSIVDSPIGRGRLATMRVRNLGPFFPSTNYIFVHELAQSTSPTSFRLLHETACEWAESQFRLPRAMRYRIPNTVTAGVSDEGFEPDLIAYATRERLWDGVSFVGGEKNSAYLYDAVERQLYSQGLEITPGPHRSKNLVASNPNNRIFVLMTEVHRRLAGELGASTQA